MSCNEALGEILHSAQDDSQRNCCGDATLESGIFPVALLQSFDFCHSATMALLVAVFCR